MDYSWQLVLNPIAKHWNLKLESMQLIRDVMNRVYRGQSSTGEKIIVRLVDNERRAIDDINQEIQWINYLNTRGREYCKLYPSPSGDFVKTCEHHDASYHVSCFYEQEGAGEILPNTTLWNNSLFTDLGAAIGKLHRLTTEYEQQQVITRHHCYQEEVFKSLSDFSSKVPEKVLLAIETLLNKIRSYPTNTSYGLVHGDIKQDNYFYTNKQQLFLYDFDQSCQSWKIYDLVVSLYFNFSYPLCKIPTATEHDAVYYIQMLIEGYNKEYSFAKQQLKLIPDLLALREALLYLVVKKIEGKLDITNNKTMAHSFSRAYQVMEQRLTQQIPHFDFDFTRL